MSNEIFSELKKEERLISIIGLFHFFFKNGGRRFVKLLPISHKQTRLMWELEEGKLPRAKFLIMITIQCHKCGIPREYWTHHLQQTGLE